MIYLEVSDILQLITLLDSFGIDEEPVEEIIVKMSDIEEEEAVICNGGKCNFFYLFQYIIEIIKQK